MRRLFVLAWCLTLAACGGPAPVDDSGLSNPASVFCEQQGGTVDIRTDEDGSQRGVCVFDDDSECDEWAFYRGECEPGDSMVGEAPRALVDRMSCTGQALDVPGQLSPVGAQVAADDILGGTPEVAGTGLGGACA